METQILAPTEEAVALAARILGEGGLVGLPTETVYGLGANALDEAAVRAITADGTTVLEEALQLPAPDDRAAAERELNSLVRQINNLGPVNQVAMEAVSYTHLTLPTTSRA